MRRPIVSASDWSWKSRSSVRARKACRSSGAISAVSVLKDGTPHDRQIVSLPEEISKCIQFALYAFEDGRPKVTQNLHLIAEILRMLAPLVKIRGVGIVVIEGHLCA